MKRRGIAYRKQLYPFSINSFNKLFSDGASLAFMYCAISERYNSTDIFVDELPDMDTMKELIDTFRAAEVKAIVIAVDCKSKIQ